jgi:putative ABC transport system substrate-binding protein
MQAGRRRALSLLVASTAGAALAQPKPERTARIGYLGAGPKGAPGPLLTAIDRRLRELDWVEGRNVTSEFRFADRKAERLDALAVQLVQARVDVIVALQTVSAHAAKRATRDIPIVFATSDTKGLVDNLARPEGNLTGVSNVGVAIAGKQMQVLKELVPKAARVVALANPENPSTPAFVRDVEAAARALGLRLEIVARRDAAEIDRALRAMSARPDMLIVQNDAHYHSELKEQLALVAALRLPAVYGAREWPDAGGLVSYGSNLRATYARLADYVDKLLRGAKPGDLPVTEPTTFELVINEATAKSLGLVITPSLSLSAQK